MSKRNEIRHLYYANYEISSNLTPMGGVSFNVSLIIDTKTKSIVGNGTIFQATNPPLNIPSQLTGDYSYMCTMNSCNNLVIADGFSPYAPLIHGIPSPAKNVALRMSLNDDWKSGVANYRYLKNGEWVESGNQQVKLVSTDPGDLTNLDQLASLVKEEV